MTYDDATHVLACSHCIGQNCRNYLVRCHILKTMPDGRKKVRTFGTMWKGQEEKSTRYVDAYRVERRNL